jgi:hypothetical protein
MGILEKPADNRTEARLAERALALTVATLILLTPPILTIFGLPVTVAGIPFLYVYCFVVWLAAIALGGRLAKRMDPRRPAVNRAEPAPPEDR